MKKQISLIIFLLIIQLSSAFSLDESKMDLIYTLKVEDMSSGIAKVNLLIEGNSSDELEFLFGSQLGGKVNNLKVTGENNENIKFNTLNGQSKIMIYAKDYSDIKISYEIDTRYYEDNQHFYQGYIGDKRSMLKGENVFMYPVEFQKYNLQALRIKMYLPDEVEVFVPWKLEEGYYLPNKNLKIKEYDYINNYIRASFAFGNYQSVSHKIGETKVNLVIPKEWSSEDKRDAVVNAFTLIGYFTKLFDDSIGEDYMLILTSPSPNNKPIQAGEWTSSQGLGVTNNDMNLERMAHQIFHRWNGFALGWEWQGDLVGLLGEGLNRYYEAKSILDRQNSLYKLTPHNIDYLEFLYQNYKTQKEKYGDLSYIEASKSEDYLVVYNSGAIIWFGLDIKIMNDTDNKYSLDDVVREFHKESVNKKGIMTKDRFIEIAKEVTGVDYTLYFDKYVFGNEKLELEEIFRDKNNNGLEDYKELIVH